MLRYFNDSPESSSSTSGRELDTPKRIVHDVLKVNKYHPYKPTIAQRL